TGRPKGVCIPHKTIQNLIQWNIREYSTSIEPSNLKVLQYTSINFDVSLQEIFFTLYSGGNLVLIDNMERKDLQLLVKIILREQITHAFMPSVILQQLCSEIVYQNQILNHLKIITVAGDKLKITNEIKDAFNLNPNLKLYNHYGPSESHVVTSYLLNKNDIEQNKYPSIGKPISNVKIHILDKNLLPVPIGVKGELFIESDYLAKGYLNLESETEKKFMIINGKRLYKTGDIGIYRECGNIDIIGRNDSQVKLRGYRVELAEIESILEKNEIIQKAIVILNNDKNKREEIVAYISLRNFSCKQDQEIIDTIYYSLKKQLPVYMIPSKFRILESFPLNKNRKIDYKALKDMEAYTPKSSHEYIEPSNYIEVVLVNIWKDILGKEQIGITDHFFELGGHSLNAIQLTSRIREEFSIEIPLVTIFDSPFIKELAPLINETGSISENYYQIKPVNRNDYLLK
ncbi:non-ribosomal peptide synthetase, partial [Bacillus cereus]|uniref:non-ribosomal peptide synthetase n=1 Tax=Bacillus cereus TaxID=1396 RepID=UPI000C007241